MIPLYDHQPTQRAPIFTVLIIIVNVLVFVGWQLQVGLRESVALAALVPVELTHRPSLHAAENLITSMFMHGGWMHLIGNMWFLWIFGNNIEDATGHFRFVIFYLLCGILAAFAHVAAEPDAAVPIVGASGAISGVLGAYLVLHPRATITTLVPLGLFTRLIEVPAFLFLLVWIGLQVLSQAVSRANAPGGGIAYLAHIGGFVAGLILIFVFKKERR